MNCNTYHTHTKKNEKRQKQEIQQIIKHKANKSQNQQIDINSVEIGAEKFGVIGRLLTHCARILNCLQSFN